MIGWHLVSFLVQWETVATAKHEALALEADKGVGGPGHVIFLSVPRMHLNKAHSGELFRHSL